MVYPEFNGQLISHSVAIMSPSHLPPPLSSPGEMLAKITEKRDNDCRLCLSHFKEWLIYVDLLLDCFIQYNYKLYLNQSGGPQRDVVYLG
jgi:hypothetical protein